MFIAQVELPEEALTVLPVIYNVCLLYVNGNDGILEKDSSLLS